MNQMKTAFNLMPEAITANENNLTVWIFAGVIALAAVAGVIYFIIMKRKK